MNWRKVIGNIWVQYTFMSLAVMLPLLLPGFILTLDLVFVPSPPWPSQLSNTYIFEALIHLLSLVIPAEVIQKLILLGSLVLSAVGAHKLTTLMGAGSRLVVWGAYFAGIFYLINPFVYSRFMAGQYLVLAGYALTPFFVMALIKLLEAPGWRNALVTTAWATAIVGLSLHHAGILLILSVLIGSAYIWRLRKKPAVKNVLLFCSVAAVATLWANSYWLVPTAFGATNISGATSNFGVAEYQAFATNDAGALGALGNVLRLQGFWVDARDMYLLPQHLVPAWGVLVLAVWALVVLGAVWAWRSKRLVVLAIASAGLVSIVLATTPIIASLSSYVPFISGYREPQKFIALLALAFAVLGGLGVIWLADRLSKKQPAWLSTGAVCAALILPIICTPTMLWGFVGQLAPRQYPADWYAINKQLNDDPSATKILFLPWHQYINFSFSERIIANPAAKFFSKPTVVGDNPEFKGIGPTVPNAVNRRIEKEVLASDPDTSTLGTKLSELGFSHVLLAKEYDYQDYSYLDRQSDLSLVQDSDSLKLYAVKGVAHE